MSAPADPAVRYGAWSTFLAGLRKRLDEICAETRAGASGLTAKDPTTLAPLKTALGALDQRVEGLRRKIEETWHAQDLDTIPLVTGKSVPAPESAYQEWYATERYVMETWTACKVRCIGDHLRAMWPLVDAALRKPVACTQCGAQLAPKTRDTSETVPCPHCRAVNQVMPEPVVGAWFADAPSSLATEQLLAQRLAVIRAGEDVEHAIDAEYRRTRTRTPETQESKARREAMARAYYEAWVAAKARVKPTPGEEQAAEVERLVAQFRLSMR